ncbi:hypothetical protein [Citrobacter braakii]|uniref:hypothetical protein n=1 Tax=Citrobacter braakii TaxID=57706 RepID=UPI003D706317
MAKKTELQKASTTAYQLLALTKAASLASENLEITEVTGLFDLAFDLSCEISTFLMEKEAEELKNGK